MNNKGIVKYSYLNDESVAHIDIFSDLVMNPLSNYILKSSSICFCPIVCETIILVYFSFVITEIESEIYVKIIKLSAISMLT